MMCVYLFCLFFSFDGSLLFQLTIFFVFLLKKSIEKRLQIVYNKNKRVRIKIGMP